MDGAMNTSSAGVSSVVSSSIWEFAILEVLRCVVLFED